MFLVGWITLWGHTVEELKSDHHLIKKNLLFRAKGSGSALMQVSKTLPTYSWNHNEFFSSILEPIPVERDYHKVK